MRSKNASGLINLMHCLSTNEGYDVNDVPLKHLKLLVSEYHGFVHHLSKYKDYMPIEITSKGEALEKIRRRMVELDLIQENNENA